MLKIGVVGLGNMGKRIFDLLKDSSFEVFGCEINDDPNEILKDCEIFILAVKPQNFTEFSSTLNVNVTNKLAISIMAGISIENLKTKLKMEKVVRTMPNLPLQVQKAFTVWKKSDAVNEEETSVVRQILQIFGEELEVVDEEKIELVGAMSGSGPAYFAFLAEQIQKYAISHGFSEDEAKKIANTTLIGTAGILEKNGWSSAELREKITSKGGITHAAITFLEEHNFPNIFTDALDAAVKRSKELNN